MTPQECAKKWAAAEINISNINETCEEFGERAWIAGYDAALAARPAPAADDAGQAVTGWRPIESAPTDGTEILLWQPNRGAAHVGSWHPLHHWHIGAVTHCHPTHWQPLPAPPTAAGDAKADHNPLRSHGPYMTTGGNSEGI